MRNAIIYSIFYSAVIVVNFLANYIPINGVSTGEISDRYNSLITPAGPAFSIWGIIYLFLLIWLIQIWVGVIKKDETLLQEAGQLVILFPLSCLFNIGWLLCWHYGYINLSMVMMVCLLLSLCVLYIVVNDMRKLWRFPFSTYMAWISVATIVNGAVIAIHNEWVLFPEEGIRSTVMMMLVATILGLFMIHQKKDLFFGLVIIWALFFILIKNFNYEVIYFSGLGFVAILLLNLISAIWARRKLIFGKTI